MTTSYTPRVYVGTYAKYNNGSIEGAWLDLENYSDKDDFLAACAELHKSESDPELMFQDFEDIPEGMISESSIEEALWDWINLDDSDKELLKVYRENIESSGDIETARDAFMGKADSPEDWAEQYADETGLLESVPDNLKYYFDWKAYARDAQMSGDVVFVEIGYRECWVFSNH